MFARFTRLPLRRCLHTQVHRPRAFKFIPVVFGVSTVTATYITWRLLSTPIALDSHTTTPSLQKPTISSKPPSKATITSPSSGSTPESSSLPDSEHPSERSATPQIQKQEKEETGEKPEETSEQQGEGEDGSKPASGGAFNPETGEINWDCPCLGGMAHGPCGPEFREAFSCFVFSEQEPKGIDCVEKFKAMQDCFRQHPEVYRDEIDDEEETAAAAGAPEATPVPANAEESASSSTDAPPISQDTPAAPTERNT